MKRYRYETTIWRDNNPEKFHEACARIEQTYPHAQKEDLLIDVDGSLIQVYRIEGKKAVIYDDYDVGGVFALSEIDLSWLIGNG